MVGSGRDEKQVIGRGLKYLPVDVIIGLAADKKQQFAVVVDVVKINAAAGRFDSFVRYLRYLFADGYLKHTVTP